MKRFTATEKWDKSWFQDLSPSLKCLWIYLCDNADPAGVWEANWRLASFQIGETFTAASLEAFGDRAEVLPSGKVWLTGFCDFQYGQLSRECRAQIHVFRSLEKHGLLPRVKHLTDTHSSNPDTLSDTLSNRVTDRELETDKEKEGDQDSGGKRVKGETKPLRPEQSELVAYVTGELGMTAGDAEHLWNVWQANGWTRSQAGKRVPIKDWKACARTWKTGLWFPSQKTQNTPRPHANNRALTPRPALVPGGDW